MTKRGAFILLEGCDRTGKSTQCQLLVDWLNTNQSSAAPIAELCKFPDRTTSIGKAINAYLQNESNLEDHVIHLLFSANRWEAAQRMESLLLSGKTLVVDRYAYSGVAFSVAKGLDLGWCRAPDIGLLSPDLTVFLDLPPAELEKRGGFGGERYETLVFQTKVRRCFHNLRRNDWKVIDASQSMEEISRQIQQLAVDTIDKVQHLPLRHDLFLN